MKILLFGKNGQVGWELNRLLRPLGEVVALDRKTADFSRPESLRSIVQEVNPDVIVNAVAYTAVDKAESDEILANKINADAPGILAEEAIKLKALLVHYSTDYVFDGTKNSYYVETDEPNPVNIYGRSKLAGENVVQVVDPDHIILRLEWVYSLRGSNFLLTMLRLMRERQGLNVVDDQIGAPTWARFIAETSVRIIAQSVLERSEMVFRSGIYHLTNSGQASWYDFAREIRDLAVVMDDASEFCEIKAISTAEYPTPAIRPVNTCMSTDSLTLNYALKIPDWKESLELCMGEWCSRR